MQAVADCVDAEVPESVIRQVGENEYQAKLHELQLKVHAHTSTHHDIASQEGLATKLLSVSNAFSAALADLS